MGTSQSKSGRVRVHRTVEFKSRLVKLAAEPGASMAGIAVAHGLNPNLLRRWIRESDAPRLPAKFVPLLLESGSHTAPQTAAPKAQRLEVSLERGDLRIQFKVDPSQLIELGQVLREVLR